MMLSTLLAAVLAVILVVNVKATSEPVKRCDLIFNTIIDMRTNVFENPTMQRLYGDSFEEGIEIVEEHLSLSLNDDEAIRQLSCEIADASSMSELAAAVNLDKNIVKEQLGQMESSADQLIQMFAENIKQLRKTHRWIKKSGFPDDWPLSVTREETKKLLKRAPVITTEFVLFYGSWDKDDGQKAAILTNSTSLDVYLQQMDLNTDPEFLDQRLKFPRAIKRKSGMLNFVRAAESYSDVFVILKELKFSSLP